MGDHMYPSSGEGRAIVQMAADRHLTEPHLKAWQARKREAEKREAASIKAELAVRKARNA